MKILIVRTGGLGDTILTLPVVHRIKKINPGVKLHMLGNETMLSVARLSGAFDGFRSIDESGFAGLFSDSEPSDFLRSYFSNFDEVYFFTAAKKEKIIYKVVKSGAGKCLVLDPSPTKKWTRHIVEHLLTIIGEKKQNSHGFCDYGIKISGNSMIDRRGVFIHPGSGSISKRWPIDRFFRVAERLITPVTFMLGPAEVESGMGNDIPENRFTIVCPESISELYSLISDAALYIGNDSGVSHLAALCGIPSFLIFGATEPVIWRPIGKNVTVISSKNGTMNEISPGDVIKLINDTLCLLL